jgi:type II secretory pathway pseudopilin PulG
MQVMDETTRYTIVAAIVGVLLLIGIPWLIVHSRRRKREKLRLRGIKTYGH